MRVRLTVIPTDDLTSVKRLTDDLRKAVNAGDMDAVDAATEKLLGLTAQALSVDLSEEEWRKLVAEIRVEHAEFQSDYLVAGSLCSEYFPEATAETTILQLPFDEAGEGDV